MSRTRPAMQGKKKGHYGPATTLEPSLIKMDILIGRRLPLHISSRRMTISIMCEFTGVPCRSSCFLIPEWCILWMCISSKAKLFIDWINSISNWDWGKAWPCLCITESKVGPMWTSFFRQSSLRKSRLQIGESERKTSCGNGLSHQRLSLHGYHLTLLGPSAVMPCVGDRIADICPSMKRTWGWRDVRSKRTYSLRILCSLVIQEARKNLLSLPTWPLNGCA